MYRRRVTLLRRVETRTGGRVAVAYEDAVADIPASIQPVSTREYTAAAATQGRISTRIVIRALAAMVEPGMRVRDDMGKVYSIEGPPLPDAESGLDYVTLMCLQGGEGT